MSKDKNLTVTEVDKIVTVSAVQSGFYSGSVPIQYNWVGHSLAEIEEQKTKFNSYSAEVKALVDDLANTSNNVNFFNLSEVKLKMAAIVENHLKLIKFSDKINNIIGE